MEVVIYIQLSLQRLNYNYCPQITLKKKKKAFVKQHLRYCDRQIPGPNESYEIVRVLILAPE